MPEVPSHVMRCGNARQLESSLSDCLALDPLSFCLIDPFQFLAKGEKQRSWNTPEGMIRGSLEENITAGAYSFGPTYYH